MARRVVRGVTHAMGSRGVGVVTRGIVRGMADAVTGALGCAVATVTAP